MEALSDPRLSSATADDEETSWVEASSEVNEVQKEAFRALLATEPYQEGQPLMIAPYDRGRNEEWRESVLRLLEMRFGPLAPEVKERVEALSLEQLRQRLPDFCKARSLKELNLED